MGPIDDPDRLELVRVGRRNGWRPALVAVLGVGIVLAVAVWKPWASGPARGAASAEDPGGTAGGLVPALTSQPGTTNQADPTPRPSPITFAALDLAWMGTEDPHVGWGVAVAYVSQRQFDLANERRASTVIPVVSWELIEPGRPGLGPRLDHPAVTNVAIAATWPPGTLPRAIRLFFTPPGGSGPGVEIPLGNSLWKLTREDPFQASESTIRSGDFYLHDAGRPDRPAAWLANGWPAGAYVLVVEVGPGVRKTLPFILGLALGS